MQEVWTPGEESSASPEEEKEDTGPVWPAKHVFFVFGGSLVTVLTFGALLMIWTMVKTAQDNGNTCITVSAPMAQFRGEVVWLDEVLTMSTIVAALSGQKQWVDRYNEHVGLLDGALVSLDRLLPRSVAEVTALKTSEANDLLVAMERAAHQAVLANDTAGAQAIVFSHEYRRQKQLYAEGYRTTEEYIEQRLSSMRASTKQAVTGGSIALGTGFVLLFCSTLAITFLWRESRGQAAVIDELLHAVNACSSTLFVGDQLGYKRSLMANDRIDQPVRETLLRLLDAVRAFRVFLPPAVLRSAVERIAAAPSKQTDPPEGAVAVLLTGIVDSARLWDAGAGMGEALELHGAVVGAATSKHGGYEVKTICGDETVFAFRTAEQAVLAAIDIQEGLLQVEWPRDENLARVCDLWGPMADDRGTLTWHGVPVRVGVAYGEVSTELCPATLRFDYCGSVVSLAATLERNCPPGGILITAQCRDEVAHSRKLERAELRPQPLTVQGTLLESALVVTSAIAGRFGGCKCIKISDAEARALADPGSVLLRLRRASERSHGAMLASTGGSRRLTRFGHPDGGSPLAALAQSQLSSRNCSLGCMLYLDSSVAGPDPDTRQATTAVAQAMTTAHTLSGRSKGVVECCLGAMAVVSWNLVRVCRAHPSQALFFASQWPREGRAHSPIGIASGLVQHGYLNGSEEHKHRALAGRPLHVAVTLAQKAARFRSRCLACFSPRPPPDLEWVMRPVDTWGLTGAWAAEGDGTLTVQEPDFDAYEQAAKLDACNSLRQLAVSSYRGLYTRVLREGDVQAFGELRALAQQNLGDPALQYVVGWMDGHIAAHPEGAPYRIVAPFWGGQADDTTGSLDEEPAGPQLLGVLGGTSTTPARPSGPPTRREGSNPLLPPAHSVPEVYDSPLPVDYSAATRGDPAALPP